MNQPNSWSWRNILPLLLLLPAPLTAIAVILALTLLIADPEAIPFLAPEEEAAEEAAVEPARTADPQAVALATINAAPPLPTPTALPPTATPEGGQAVEVSAAELPYSQDMLDAGQVNFLSTCSACHNTDARGIAGLGKTLVESEFVRSRTDEELLAFVIVGRQSFEAENTTGVSMPPRGGNPGLTDEDILEIIAYIRLLDGVAPPGAEVATAPEGEQPTTTDTTDTTDTTNTGTTETTAPAAPPEPFVYVEPHDLLASLGVALPDAMPQPELSGEELYAQRCAVCHGENGEGVQGRGVSLHESDVLHQGDHDMIFHIIEYGVPVWSSENETGVHMPMHGGYPLLTDAQIEDLIAYLQTFH